MFYILMLKNSQTREVNFDKKNLPMKIVICTLKSVNFSEVHTYVALIRFRMLQNIYRNTTTISTSTLPLWTVSFSESQSPSNTPVSSLCLRPKIYYNGIVYLLTTT